ncbi:MAG: hypothetical protein J6C82_08710 [Clostridia bacterium]|nr:hypothetical protein [Clostridia bacterium]
MRSIQMPQPIFEDNKVYIKPEENAEFYHELQLAILLSLKNSRIISTVQYELCTKRMFDLKYGL